MNMELGLGNTLLAGDPRLVDHIVGEVKSQGIFDQFRKECIADVDTKPAYQNLRTRVESSVNSFLGKQTWKADLNKNQLRETLRKHIHEAPYLDAGVERIVDQVVNPKVYSVFMPQIEDVVYKFLGLERPKNRRRNGPCGFKDLLPIDLDPVSPESDKNSLRDVSLDSVDARIDEPPDSKSKEIATASSLEPNHGGNEIEENPPRNGHSCEDLTSQDVPPKPPSVPQQPANSSLNNSSRSDDKNDEEEEDSPTFEPIDIMNLNDSQISNDSHLSGISELTSHRSRSPDFSNDGSRDNMDFSCHDSEFSKVSSDSRLSIVTDFGSSNHDSAQLSESHRDEKEKNDGKYSKDNFKAVREFESGKGSRATSESSIVKETIVGDGKSIRRSLSSKETSRDGMEISIKEKIKENDTSKSKTTKERGVEKDSKKDRDKELLSKKQTNNHGDAKSDKSSKPKSKEKSDISRGSFEKTRERDSSTKPKDDKLKESEKKESANAPKEVKDLKDIYKEKIRELREKKELLREKRDCEKIGKDNKDAKTTKDSREKRDSSREKKDTGKESSKNSREKSSSRSDGKSSKITEKDGKIVKGDSKDKGKRDERRYSRDHKSRSSSGQSDEKRTSRSERDEKIDKSETKQKSLVKKDSSNKNADNNKRDSRGEIEAKDKKRRDEKKTKTKDDHSSMRKNTDDRRSTDRDGSNGSNGKTSQKSSSGSSASSTKPVASSLSKESTNTSSNCSSETSDNVEESQNEKLRNSIDERQSERDSSNGVANESSTMHLDLTQGEISLPLKKRPLTGDDNMKIEITMKKPKFAKNFQEAKKLMKIRRKIEKEKIRQRLEMENQRKIESIESRSNSPVERTKRAASNDIQSVPDDERVQIIEVRDEEYDEPYPEIRSDFTMEERSQIILGGGESMIFASEPTSVSRSKSTLSEMELSIRESLNEMINDKKIDESSQVPKNSTSLVEPETERSENLIPNSGDENASSSKFAEEVATEKDLLRLKDSTPKDEAEEVNSKGIAEGVVDNETKIIEDENRVKGERDEEIVCKLEKVEDTEEMEIAEAVEGKVDKSENKLSHEIAGDEEKLEVPEVEEKITPEMVNKDNNVAEPEGQLQIVETPENVDQAKFEEKSTLEIVEKTAKIESPESEEKFTPELVEKTTKIESLKSEEKMIPIIIKKEENAGTAESKEITPLEIVKKEENIETAESEEKLSLEIVEKREKVENSEWEEKLKPEIVGKEENIDVVDSGEKSLSEFVENQEKFETPEPNKEPELKIVEEQKNIEASTSEKRSTPEVFEESKKIASPKSDDKSRPAVVKKQKKREAPKLEDTLAPEVAKKQKKVESPKSEIITKEKTSICESSISKIVDLCHENASESCNKDDTSSTETVGETEDRDAACESDDDEPCRYFTVNNERLERFEKFVKSLETDDDPSCDDVVSEEFLEAAASSEEMVSSVSKTMAPPKPKRKYSTSPLTDIMLNNTNNNNDADKITPPISDADDNNSNSVKKRKIGRPRKQKSNPNLCSQQNLLNGENFVMPLSPESDVSATSEKTPSNSIKDEKSRPRGSNQRYTSDDLYKPRPLFASSSRRSRRSNPA